MQMRLHRIPLAGLHFFQFQIRRLLADQFAQLGHSVVARVKRRIAAGYLTAKRSQRGPAVFAGGGVQGVDQYRFELGQLGHGLLWAGAGLFRLVVQNLRVDELVACALSASIRTASFWLVLVATAISLVLAVQGQA